jgi:hypothetical protein
VQKRDRHNDCVNHEVVVETNLHLEQGYFHEQVDDPHCVAGNEAGNDFEKRQVKELAHSLHCFVEQSSMLRWVMASFDYLLIWPVVQPPEFVAHAPQPAVPLHFHKGEAGPPGGPAHQRLDEQRVQGPALLECIAPS